MQQNHDAKSGGKGLGIFERLPEGIQTAEFSDTLKRASATHARIRRQRQNGNQTTTQFDSR